MKYCHEENPVKESTLHAIYYCPVCFGTDGSHCTCERPETYTSFNTYPLSALFIPHYPQEVQIVPCGYFQELNCNNGQFLGQDLYPLYCPKECAAPFLLPVNETVELDNHAEEGEAVWYYDPSDWPALTAEPQKKKVYCNRKAFNEAARDTYSSSCYKEKSGTASETLLGHDHGGTPKTVRATPTLKKSISFVDFRRLMEKDELWNLGTDDTAGKQPESIEKKLEKKDSAVSLSETKTSPGRSSKPCNRYRRKKNKRRTRRK